MAARGRRPGLVLGYALAAVGRGRAHHRRGHAQLPAAPRRERALRGRHGIQQPEPVCRSRPRAPGAPRARPQHRRLGDHGRQRASAPTSSAPAPRWPGRSACRRSPGPSSSRCSACCSPSPSSSCGCDPTRSSRPGGAASPTATTSGPAHGSVTRGLRVAAGIPAARLGMLTLALGHVVMVSVMVMTPLHMSHGDAGLEVIGLRHQHPHPRHVRLLAADRPGGRPLRRPGRRRARLGRAVDGRAARVGLARGGVAHPGRSACSCSGSAGRARSSRGRRCSPPPCRRSERPGAQGASDLLMGLMAGAGGALAGRRRRPGELRGAGPGARSGSPWRSASPPPSRAPAPAPRSPDRRWMPGARRPVRVPGGTLRVTDPPRRLTGGDPRRC